MKILLKDITGLVEPLPASVREVKIQNGTHYCEMLPLEYKPSDNYMKAYKNNYKKFLVLQKVIPNGGEFTTKGECNMNISCGGIYHMGITISQWYNHLSHPNCFPIKSEQDLTSVISDYEYCKLRAEEVSTLLFHE